MLFSINFSQNEFSVSRNLYFLSGLKFLSKNVVVSAGIDQRVKIWRLLENASMVLSKDIFTSVADVSGLNVWKDR